MIEENYAGYNFTRKWCIKGVVNYQRWNGPWNEIMRRNRLSLLCTEFNDCFPKKHMFLLWRFYFWDLFILLQIFDFANFQVQEKENCHYKHLHFIDLELNEACILQLPSSILFWFVFDTMMKQHLAVIFMSKVRFSSVALYWHICSFLLGFCERYILPICNKIFFLHFQLKFILPEK